MKFSHISNPIKKGVQIVIVLATLFLNFGMGGTHKAYAAACDPNPLNNKLLTIAGGGGTVVATPLPDCDGGTRYSLGTVVTLTASASSGYTFVDWRDGSTGATYNTLIGTTNPIDVTMNTNKSIIVKFSPPNDSFANATLVNPALPYTDTVYTTGAVDAGDGPAIPNTKVCDPEKPSQPILRKGLRNVWYSYTANETKLITVDTLGSTPPALPTGISSFDTYIAVWTGPDINNLTLVECDDDTGGTLQSAVRIPVTNGTTYYIEAAQWNNYTNVPAERPSGGALKLNVRNFVQSFADVPFENPYFIYIEALYAAGLTGGCGTAPLVFCPDTIMNRGQMAVFTLRGQFGSSYAPPSPPYLLQDNWVKLNMTWAESWSNGMIKTGLSGGCATTPKLLYCPETQTTKEQAAVFALRLKHGSGYTPPAATGAVFADMPNASYWSNSWAEQAFAEGLIPSCGTDPVSGKPNYCPGNLVDRGFGSYIIAKAKGLVP